MASGIGFTPELVRQLEKELDRHRAAAREHQVKAEAILKILAGASELEPEIFKGAGSSDEADPEPKKRTGRVSMPDAIRSILGERNMTKLGLRERLTERYPDIRIGESGQYFYKTVRRLEESGEIKKRGKMLRLSA